MKIKMRNWVMRNKKKFREFHFKFIHENLVVFMSKSLQFCLFMKKEILKAKKVCPSFLRNSFLLFIKRSFEVDNFTNL